jgi:NADPH-dependent F420 reductase
MAAELSAGESAGAISGADNATAIRSCDTVVLAVPFAHAAATIDHHRDAFRPGTVVIDITVPLVFGSGPPRLVPPPVGSAAEHLRARLPADVRLACAFKTIPARLLEQVAEPLDCDEFVCGDSPEARQRATAIVTRLPGLRAIDAGTLDAARALEHMTWLAVVLNKRYRRHGGRFRVVGI